MNGDGAPSVFDNAPYYPAVLPGEALYSFLGRMLMLLGEPFATRFVQEVTGNAGRRLSLALPCRLNWFRMHLPSLQALSLEDAFRRFTIAPLFRPFLCVADCEEVEKQLAGEGSVAARMRLGLVRGAGEQTQPLHCSSCMQEQWEEFGTPYWPMRFAIPYVRACPVHQLRLEPVRGRGIIRFGKHQILAPPSFDGFSGPSEPASWAQSQLARLAIDLHAAALAPVPAEVLVDTYVERISQLGMSCGRERVKRGALWQHLQDYWQGLDVVKCSPGREIPAWVCQLYTQGKTMLRVPLHHLLAIGVLAPTEF